MIRRKFLILGAILAGIALAGLASPARADFEIQFEFGGGKIVVDGTTSTAVASGGASLSGSTITFAAGKITISNLTVSPTGTVGGFLVSSTITKSNSPGAATATLSSSSLDLINQTGVAGSSTIKITAGDTGFKSPSGTTVTLLSTVSATADGANTHNGTVVFNSYLDTTNAQFGTPASGAAPTINLTVAPGASQSGNSSANVPGTPTPYSLTQIGQYSLFNGEDFTDGSSGTTVTAPAPAGLLLAISGLPVLGITTFLRRRKVAVA